MEDPQSEGSQEKRGAECGRFGFGEPFGSNSRLLTAPLYSLLLFALTDPR